MLCCEDANLTDADPGQDSSFHARILIGNSGGQALLKSTTKVFYKKGRSLLWTDLLYGAHDPEEVEAGQLLEVLEAPAVRGQQGREQGRIGGYVLQALRHPARGWVYTDRWLNYTDV
jgi:hypothetical protein